MPSIILDLKCSILLGVHPWRRSDAHHPFACHPHSLHQNCVAVISILHLGHNLFPPFLSSHPAHRQSPKSHREYCSHPTHIPRMFSLLVLLAVNCLWHTLHSSSGSHIFPVAMSTVVKSSSSTPQSSASSIISLSGCL